MKDDFVLFIMTFIHLMSNYLSLDKSVFIQHKNLEILATEMFGVYTAATDILNKVFLLKPPSNYNLRNQQEFTL